MLQHIIQRAYSFMGTLESTYDLALLCADLKGDYVECGVAGGAQVAAMALAAPEKKIWLFDSFEGIPIAGKHDDSQPGIGPITNGSGELISSGVSSCSIEGVKSHMKDWGIPLDNMKFVEGWFQNTMPKNRVKDIALLRLDGDLYESTLICLEYLYPKLIKGGYLIIDDYALTGCRKAVDRYLLSAQFTEVDGGGGVVYLQK